MPFEKGNQLAKGEGRKGFEFEEEQLGKMRNIVSADLKILEKIYNGKATEKDFKKLVATQQRINKYLDKLHASKQESSHNIAGELKIVISQESAKKHGLHTSQNTETSSS